VTDQKDTVKNIFQCNEEPTAKDAAWTADNVFKKKGVRSPFAHYEELAII